MDKFQTSCIQLFGIVISPILGSADDIYGDVLLKNIIVIIIKIGYIKLNTLFNYSLLLITKILFALSE